MSLKSPLAQIEFFKRGQDVQLTDNFHLSEFECKCSKCLFTLISVEHVTRLQELRNALKTPIKVLSGYRCSDHNQKVGGEPQSLHQFGLATDIWASGYSSGAIYEIAKDIFDGIGLYDTWTHIDSRGFEAFWDKRRS